MYNTGNPVPSAALEDMTDNAQTFDALVTKTEGTTTDRLGNTRRVFQQILMDMGFQPLSGSFQTGATITARNQTLYDEVSHVFYAWGGTIPVGGYIVQAGSTPATSGGIGAGAWSDKTDLMLRGELLLGAIKERNSRYALRDFVTVNDYGAAGDGVTNDISAFTLNDTDTGSVYCPDEHTYNLGSTVPDFTLKGGGDVIANGVHASLNNVTYNPEFEIFSHTPKDYKREQLGITYPPPPFETAPGYQKRHRTIYSLGSQLGDPSKLAGYVTAFGNYNGANFNQWFAVDAFGGDTLMYAYNVERTVAVGSEALAWFGAPSYDYLVQFSHDWFRKPKSNPYLPGDPLWNPNGLATIFPTLSAEIGNFTGYATSTADASHTTAVGRDAGNHTVAGTNNTLIGYGSGQDLYAGSRNTAVGALSLQSPIFATQIAAFGTEAGRYCKDSIDAVFVGHRSGRTVQNASRSVFIGARAGDDVINGEGAVIIGHEAGKGHTSLNDVLSISNGPLQNRKPLIGGKFDSNYAGVNADPSLMRAKWHVRNANSGSNLTPAVGILVEGENQAAVTVETTATGLSSYRFATPADVFVAGMEYSPDSNSITFKTNSTSQVRIDDNGTLRPIVDNVKPLGSAQFKWSQLFAGAGAINTSDERVKTFLDIDAAEYAVAKELKGMIRKFKFNDAIEAKGIDGARIHFGVGAQSVGDVFTAHGLDPHNYALFCYDEWEGEFEEHAAEYEEIPAVTEEVEGVVIEIAPATKRLVKEAYTVQTQVAGNRYGIRYDELAMFILSAM